MGVLCKRIKFDPNKWIVCAGAVFGVGLTAYLSGRIGRIDINGQDFQGNIALFYALASVGILMSICVGRMFDLFVGKIELVKYISRNTIVILLLHGAAGTLIKGVVVYLFHQPVSVFDGNNWLNAGYSLITILVLIPIIYLINNYAPWSVGKQR